MPTGVVGAGSGVGAAVGAWGCPSGIWETGTPGEGGRAETLIMGIVTVPDGTG